MWFIGCVALAADGNSLKHAADLPVIAHQLRLAGVPSDDVGEAIEATTEKGLTAEASADVLAEAGKGVEEHGPVDNFGAFVRSKLDEGLRGQELAAAIRAEHVAHGKGKGHGKPDEPGKSDEHGKSGDHGKSDEHGKSGDHGKSDEHGKSGERGKPPEPGEPTKGKGTSRAPEPAAQPAGKGKGSPRTTPAPTPAPAAKGKGTTR